MPPGPDQHAALVTHLSALVTALLVDPLEILLELDQSRLRQQVGAQAEVWADRLLGPDDQLAARTAAQLVSSLYPGDRPFSPTVEWWRTPLGQVVASLIGHPTAEALSYAEAGAMLGITRQGVHDLVSRGKLEPHPAGGVTNASVRARVKSRAALRRAQRGEQD